MARCCAPSPCAVIDFLAEFLSPNMSQPATTFNCLLDVINYCDDFPHPTHDLKAYTSRLDALYHFKVSTESATLGYMLPSVARTFSSYPNWSINSRCRPKTLTLTAGPDATSRSAAVASTLASLREKGTFAVLSNWRDELKPAYGAAGNLLFSIERAAFPLLGIVGYGVMLIAYTCSSSSASSSLRSAPPLPSPSPSPSPLSSRDVRNGDTSRHIDRETNTDNRRKHIAGIWVQRRSHTARTHAGYLDGTAAGGLPANTLPFAALLAEAEEEASLPRDFVASRAQACGTLSYFHTRKREMGGEVGLLQPGVHFLYEMEFGDGPGSGLGEEGGVRPSSSDENVEGFELLTPRELKGEMLAGRVKPWFALAVIEFYVRHGIINEENERDYVEICMRLHRKLEFPVFGVSFLNR